MISMLLLFSSSFMYVLENEAQADKFPSIPAAMWWGIATLTTVGYGDVFPVTPPGKLLGAFIAILGIGIFALPAGILASGFAEELSKRHRKKEECRCPHCGKDISDKFIKRPDK
jgi:voltage-gated potassium channel